MRRVFYEYQVGDIITDVKSGKLKILEQIRINKNKSKVKGYKYQCLICNNEDIIKEELLLNNHGCNVCSGHKIKIGYNDMWTTNPELAKLLLNPEDGYKYMQNANQYVDWKCPDCGNIIKNKQIEDVNKRGLSCLKCSDKLPYTEKFVFNILQQLNIDFKTQLTRTTLKWCNN